jgi:hypothetical protein
MKKAKEPASRFTLPRGPVFSTLRLLALIFCCVGILGQTLSAAPAANLDQGRNGSAASPINPVDWVNGNLNANQSHYLEGYSIPYRLIMTEMPIGTEVVLTLAYDATHGGKHALDFLTHYQCMDYPSHEAYFGHAAETVDPLVGIPLIGSDPMGLDDSVTDGTLIAPPPGTGTVSYAPDQPAAGFAANPCEKLIQIYGAEFSSLGGPEFAYSQNNGTPQEADITLDQSEQRFTVRFTPSSPTVVLAWGGHIASRYDWGVDPSDGSLYSASGLNGSPYHMRMIDWNLGNLGNQDRSLSAGAVIVIPECEIEGSQVACHEENLYVYTMLTAATSYSWQIIPGPAPQYYDATIIDVSPDGTTVTVSAPGPNTGLFTLVCTLDEGLISQNTCEYIVEVKPNPDCLIEGAQGFVPPNTTLEYSAPAGMDSYFWSVSGEASINGAADQATVSITTSAACEGTYTLSLSAASGGCDTDCDVTATLKDGTSPGIECSSVADRTVECSESTEPDILGFPIVSDECDDAPVVSYIDVEDLDACGLGTITRTWTATDAAGNWDLCEQVITVIDSTAPMLSDYPQDAEVPCDAIPTAPELTASDNCTENPDVAFEETDNRDLNCGTGTIIRKWTATDCFGNTDVWEQTLTVVDTMPPVLSATPQDDIVECDAIPNAPIVTAIDNCSILVPVNFDEITDINPDCGTGTITRTWTATDCSLNITSWTQTLTVVDNTPPVLAGGPADITVECDNIPVAATLTATDNCTANPVVGLEETDNRNPDCGTGTIIRTWSVSDCAGNSDTWTQVITVVDRTDPVLSDNPADDIVECDAVPDAPVLTATDTCSVNVSVDFEEADERGDCGTGTITRTWTATDCAGNTDVWIQVLTVVDNTPPVLSGNPADDTVQCNAIPDPPVLTATDNCGSSPVVALVQTGELGDCGTGTLVRTWTATDCSGNTDVWVQTLTVVDTTAPVVTCPDDTTVECGNSVHPDDTGYATGVDTCGSEPVITYEDSSEIDGCGGTILRTWTATDCSGNSDSCVQVITVIDTTAPVITVPGDVDIECDEDPAQVDTGMATAIDNCDSAPVITSSDESSFDDCGYETITRTWTATDCAGNSSSGVQVISIGDSTAPVIDGPADVIYVCDDCTETNTHPDMTGYATALDNCDGPLEVDYLDEIIGDCPLEIRRTWFATDCAGNLGTHLQRITCLSENEVTDSSLCIFDRDPDNEFDQDFRLLFTPDIKHVPAYKISSTQPGQTFYNIFYLGTPGDEVSFEVCIPYPYVTHGATPIHAYDWVHLEECDGSVGLVPGNAFYNDKTQITLDDYGPDGGFGSEVCLVNISFTIPESGFAYLNIHLEHGLPGTGGYSQDLDGNAFDLDSGEILVPNKFEHIFSVSGSVEGSDSIVNLNDFKGGPGVAGTVVNAGSGEPVKGAVLVLKGNRGRVQISQETDANGSYFIPFIRKGHPGVYELWMMTPSGVYQNRNVLLKANGFSVQDFIVDSD